MGTELEEKSQVEIIADTKEEKKLLSEKIALEKSIKEEQEKNIVLEKEAEKFDKLVSTMDSEAFIELKNLVNEGLKSYIDRGDCKEAQKKFNNFKSICQMEDLLTEYRELANENRQNVIANNQDIERMKDKIDEIESKLQNRQIKMFNEEQGEGAEQ